MAWSGVLASAYNSEESTVFATNGTLLRRLNGIYSYAWGISSPTTIPVIVAGSLTGLTGTYNAKYAYARKERQSIVCESNLSVSAVSSVTLSDQSLSITATAPTDEQVNCIRFYRTVAGECVLLLFG